MRRDDHYTVGDALMVLVVAVVEYWWVVALALLIICAPHAHSG